MALRKLFNPLRNTLDSLIEYRLKLELVKTSSKVRRYRSTGVAKDKTIFCIGNGPSLNEAQVQLASEHLFIATNRAYQLFPPERFSSGGNGWLFINDFFRSIEVLPTLVENMQQVVIGCHNPKNIYAYKNLYREPWIFANCKWGIKVGLRGLQLVDQSYRQEFSADFPRHYFCGRSVIFSAIQFAAYLNPKRIVLIGCDMDYSGPASYSSLVREERHGVGHLGRFDYTEHGKKHMVACREGLAKLGIEFLNATPSGAIQEIPRVTLDELSRTLHSERTL